MDKQEIIEEVLNVMLKKVNETKEEYESYVAYNLYSPDGAVNGYGEGFRTGVNEGMARLMVAVAKEYNRTVIENKDKDSAQVLYKAITELIKLLEGENELVLEYGCRYLNSEFECEKGLLISGKCPNNCIYYDDGSR